MRKIVMFNMVSVDGYFAGADGNIDWHVVDGDFNKYAVEFLKDIDVILFGRVTFELFESYWPGALTDPATGDDDRVIAKAINDATKFVFSKSTKHSDWHNTEIRADIDPEEIKKLKEQDGKNIAIYGSGTIVQQLTEMGLIDEYRMMVAPVVLGEGKPLFKDVKMMKLKLIETKPFTSGNVLLAYRHSA